MSPRQARALSAAARMGRWVGREALWAARDAAAHPRVTLAVLVVALWLWVGSAPGPLWTRFTAWTITQGAAAGATITPAGVHHAAAALILVALVGTLVAAHVETDRTKTWTAEDRHRAAVRGTGNVLWLSLVALVAGCGLSLGAALWVGTIVAAAALVTVRWRAHRRLARRLRIAAAVTMGEPTERVRIGRLRWRGRDLVAARLRWPATWRVAEEGRRDRLTDAVVWELCGPAPEAAADLIRRPEYALTWDQRERSVTVRQTPRLPHAVTPTQVWTHPDGAVLGQTDTKSADAVVTQDGQEVPVVLVPMDRHMLWTGATQYGKSSAVRWTILSALMGGHLPAGAVLLDCKGSGSFAGLMGRPGVHAVAHHPAEWAAALDAVLVKVSTSYEEMLAWRSGQSGVRPSQARGLIVVDEVQMLDGQEDALARLARLALESGWLLWCITQRPDAKDAIPGAIRDQLQDRVSMGPLSGTGARMTYDTVDGYERAMTCLPIPGRAVARIGGRWRTVQVPWCPQPADGPAAEALYPARIGQEPRLVAAHPVEAGQAPQVGAGVVDLDKARRVNRPARVPLTGVQRLMAQAQQQADSAAPEAATGTETPATEKPRPVIEPTGLYVPPTRKKRR